MEWGVGVGGGVMAWESAEEEHGVGVGGGGVMVWELAEEEHGVGVGGGGVMAWESAEEEHGVGVGGGGVVAWESAEEEHHGVRGRRSWHGSRQREEDTVREADHGEERYRGRGGGMIRFRRARSFLSCSPRHRKRSVYVIVNGACLSKVYDIPVAYSVSIANSVPIVKKTFRGSSFRPIQ